MKRYLFYDTTTTEFYTGEGTLSLPDALPIFLKVLDLSLPACMSDSLTNAFQSDGKQRQLCVRA